ncbi:MAG: CPBP family intramembrane metalloprotease [Saprospiraceae bacterium]|nr:CPBP family intramembrane metalloprotease [Saprospiraceae bacterium]
MNKIGTHLRSNAVAKWAELVFIFAAIIAFIQLLKPLAGEDLIWNQAILWVGNMIMLSLVWLGLRLRGESLANFGLSFSFQSGRDFGRVLMLSVLVFVLALSGFVLGSIIMANITGIPESADMSGYNYLENNIGWFILSLIGVLIVSSIGEEIIYRGFLINRITQLFPGNRHAQTIAVIVSAIVFGLIHYGWGPMGMVQTGFMGLALGICYIKMKKRLIIMILAHAYMDTILMVQMYLGK